jgi:hypothetical protein
MEIETAWVKPPLQIGGLDHLAVQAPCINIYSRLIPGITNVTDRARYYSFYPWLIWAFDQAGIRAFDDEFIELFRRADCLFTLIAERHAVVQGDTYERHAAAMVGSNTFAELAGSLDASSTIRLSDYSHRETAKQRYFKNNLGGLGQYYIGVLRELNVLDGDSRNGIKYTRQIGQPVAKRMDAGVDRAQFMDIVRSGMVTSAQLVALESFCPCFLPTQAQELEILVDLFFVRGIFADEDALPRRRSLQAIISLATRLFESGLPVFEATFRACTYTGHLPDGSLWTLPDRLLGNRARWALYSRNELLSVAVQGLFFALLDAYEESRLKFQTGRELVRWALSTPEVRGTLQTLDGGRSFADQVRQARDWMPDVADWRDPLHEVSLAETVVESGSERRSPERREAICLAALRILVALAARAPNDLKPYGTIEFQADYFKNYPINLRSFQRHCSTDWPALPMRDVLAWLLDHWGLELHLRVALRKLRGQSQSTFRIRPSDRGLEVIEPPAPAHTRPRFRQSLTILKDLGLLADDGSGALQPTDRCLALMELSDVS